MNAVATEYLDLLRESGFRVFSEGDRLYVQPRERLTPADVELIKNHKQAIMHRLANESELVRCDGCGSHCNPAMGDDVAVLCDRMACAWRRKSR